MSWARKKFLWMRYQIGKLLFPLLEPLFILRENLRSGVRRHFDQAIRHIENKNYAVAQLNLNMVLSLNPKHFLAHVYRGRIFLKQKQYRMASEDLVQANRISAFRFTHYRLYREYLESIGEGSSWNGEGFPSAQGMGRLQGFQPHQEGKGYESNESPERPSPFDDYFDVEEEPLAAIQDLELTSNERDKFNEMGPITEKESKNQDWDHILKKLTS